MTGRRGRRRAPAAVPLLLASIGTAHWGTARASDGGDGSSGVRPAEGDAKILAELDAWLIERYTACWRSADIGPARDYVPQLGIRLAPDGSLIGTPTLLNPPNSPARNRVVDSALRAVNRCDPLPLPARFRPYYERGYKQRVIRFDPNDVP